MNCKDTNSLGPLQLVFRSASAPLRVPQRKCVELLLNHGADPNCADTHGRTAVIHAARLGDLATIRILVEANAYVRARDRFHRTALMYAVEAHRRAIVDYLASNGDLQSLNPAQRKSPTPGKGRS